MQLALARSLAAGTLAAAVAPLASGQGSPCGWHAVPGAPQGRVDALFVHHDTLGHALYAGGAFQGIEPAMQHVARFDGSVWSALDTGTDGAVRAFASYYPSSGPLLVALGDFTVAGGQPAPGIAFFDGSTWTAPPAPPLAVLRAAVHFDGPAGPELVVVGDAAQQPLQALWSWDGATWTPTTTVNDALTDVAVHEGVLHAAGPFGIESWDQGVATFEQFSHFFPSRFALLPGANGDHLACIGSAFEVFTIGSPPVPKGRAVHVRDAGLWQIAQTNVAAADFAEWHDVRFAVPWDAPHGPSYVLVGDFVRQSGTWIDNEGFAYATSVAHGNAQLDALLPMPARLDGPVRALVAFDDGAGERLFAGGSQLSSAGIGLGALAALERCQTVPPAWHDVPGCTSTETLSSPFDQPVLGTTYTIEARSESGMLAEAWLFIGLGLLTDGVGCGVPLEGVGELLVDQLLLAGNGLLLLPSFYLPVGPTSTLATWEIGLPAEPALVGFELVLQALSRSIDTGAFGLSTALSVRLGN